MQFKNANKSAYFDITSSSAVKRYKKTVRKIVSYMYQNEVGIISQTERTEKVKLS